MGYVASYINLRFLESMLAYQELQAAGELANPPFSAYLPSYYRAYGKVLIFSLPSYHTAGLVPLVGPNPAELATMVGQVRAALTKRFALPSGGVLSWYGCKCVNETSTQVSFRYVVTAA